MGDMMSAAMELLGVINSVYAGLFLMPFLVLNTFFLFLQLHFLFSRQTLSGTLCACILCAQKIPVVAWVTLRSPLCGSVYSSVKMGMLMPTSQGRGYWGHLWRSGCEVMSCYT